MQESVIQKYIQSSGNTRLDIHRPLGFYENLFVKHQLQIINITSTKALTKHNIGDFLILTLSKT